MDNKYAFISYSTKNQAEADALKKLLNDEGIDTWMAPGNIPAGTRYAEIINRAVKECTCFILVLTEESQNSIWVAKETERAVNYRKPIFPVQLSELILNDEFELYISTDQIVAVKKIDRNTEEIQKLISGIVVHTGRKAKEPEPAAFSSSLFGGNSQNLPPAYSVPHPAVMPNTDTYRQKESAKLQDYINFDGRIYSCTEVGRGFLGTAYKAVCAEDNSVLAIKKYEAGNAFQVPLFSGYDLSWKLREIKHENLCRLFDVKRAGTPMLVMEYIEGTTLSSYISKPVHDFYRSLIIMQQILSGLSCLHRNNIYYGDLTPDNVMIENTGRAVLCDFSQSNFNNSRIDQLTMLLHKYRSPERYRGLDIDYRSDIFEAGMLLDSMTINEITYSMDWDFSKIRGPHALNNPAELMIRKIILKATEIDKENRYQSADEMISAINTALENE